MPPDNPNATFELMNKDSMNASWSLDSRLKLALAAVEFFNVENRVRMAELLRNNGSTEVPLGSNPFSLMAFAHYLEATNLFPRKPNYFRVRHIESHAWHRLANLFMSATLTWCPNCLASIFEETSGSPPSRPRTAL